MPKTEMIACKSCGNERPVQIINGKPKNELCLKCSIAKQNRVMSGYYRNRKGDN